MLLSAIFSICFCPIPDFFSFAPSWGSPVLVYTASGLPASLLAQRSHYQPTAGGLQPQGTHLTACGKRIHFQLSSLFLVALRYPLWVIFVSSALLSVGGQPFFLAHEITMRCILPEVQLFRMPFDTEELNSCCSLLFKRHHELREAIETHTSLSQAAVCGLSDIYEALNCTSGSTKRYLINKHIRLSALETLLPSSWMLYEDV